jgi:hypothetical protein
MHKSATKCNETVGKWCKNKHGASKIIDTLETYQLSTRTDACIDITQRHCSSSPLPSCHLLAALLAATRRCARQQPFQFLPAPGSLPAPLPRETPLGDFGEWRSSVRSRSMEVELKIPVFRPHRNQYWVLWDIEIVQVLTPGPDRAASFLAQESPPPPKLRPASATARGAWLAAWPTKPCTAAGIHTSAHWQCLRQGFQAQGLIVGLVSMSSSLHNWLGNAGFSFMNCIGFLGAWQCWLPD